MVGKTAVIFLLALAYARAQSFEEILRSIQAKKSFEGNPCSGRTGVHFARNYRGCSWYFACGSANNVIREDRCHDGLIFNYEEQKCDYVENVKCSIDDENEAPQVCPPGSRGIYVIPHPYSCTKYTGL